MSSVYFDPALGGDGSTVTDDANATTGLANGGHRTRFVPALAQAVAVANFTLTKATAADASADAAAVSAVTALSAPGTTATSTTSLTIGIASKSLTIQTGKTIPVGASVKIASTASPTNWMHGDVTAYNTSTGALTVNVTATNGSGTVAAWTVSLSGPLGPQGVIGLPGLAIMIRAPKSAAYTLLAADHSKLIDCTGTFELSFTAPATLGSGWWTYLRNTGTGNVTLNNVDGLASYIMYPGEVRMIQCDGTTLRSIVVHGFYATFTSSGNFVTPPGYKRFAGLIWAGGSAGGKAPTAYGGAGGACAPIDYAASAVPATVSFTIGAGGATTGALGGDSAFIGVNAYANGVSLFPETSHAADCGDGSVCFGKYSLYGSYAGAAASVGPSVIYGGAPGGWVNGGVVFAPGTSVFGGSGGAASLASSGSAGIIPGGGGGATETGPSGGAGARGELRLWGVV